MDKQNAVAPINIVVGAENKRVYFYNSTGVAREMSLKDFMKDLTMSTVNKSWSVRE